MTCMYKDPETGWCKLHSDWSSPMPVIEYCIEGPCPDEKHPTNADRIRGMSDEDLAEFLWGQNGSNRYWKSVQKYLDWLRQSAETEGTE